MSDARPVPPWDVTAWDDERRLRALLWAAGAVFVVAFLAFIARGADGPPDPFFAQTAEASTLPGFEELAIRIDGIDGVARDFCVLLADDDAARQQGMRGRSDFAGYAGMLFSHDADVTAGFTMDGVPIALSAGFFDGTGTFTGAIGLAPCPAGGGCPTYAPPGPFRWALEVPEGALPSMGVGPGARIEERGACGGE